ncbi:MAG: Gfo/Idh/MocA family oxidoreductase [Epulopiscium sp.]|nr:Gfo/Idh/MocA family oxidoreductase [Candidatus Epulonipiscium sp.]
MYKIGVVNLDTSHPKAFSTYLNQGNRARYAAVYNDGFRGDDEVESFMESNKITKRYDSVFEMAQNVDIGFVQGCNWDKHVDYAQAFIDAGKPVFIDKPIVGSLKDCKRIEEMVQKGGVVLGSSSLRYADEVTSFISVPIEERGEIVHVTATVGVDEFNYAIHAVETIMGIVGDDARAESVTYIGKTDIKDAICESYFIKFENGITAMYHSYLNCWQPSTMTVMTTKKTTTTVINAGVAYGAMLDQICDFLDGKKNILASAESLTESIKIMLAGRLSKQKSGIPVLICELPLEDPGFDGSEFELNYGAAASKIYLAK